MLLLSIHCCKNSKPNLLLLLNIFIIFLCYKAQACVFYCSGAVKLMGVAPAAASTLSREMGATS